MSSPRSTITRFELGNLMAAGDQVVAVIQIEATVRAMGKRLRDLELHLWTSDARGQAAKFLDVVDTHKHWLLGARDAFLRGVERMSTC